MVEIGFLFTIIIHVILTILWVGGMTSLALVFIPSAKKALPDKKLINKLMLTTQKSLNIYAYIAMIGLTTTGILLAIKNKALLTMFSFSTTYLTLLGIKVILSTIMIIIGLTRTLYIPSMKASPETKESLKITLLFTNVTLGWVVVILSTLLPEL